MTSQPQFIPPTSPPSTFPPPRSTPPLFLYKEEQARLPGIATDHGAKYYNNTRHKFSYQNRMKQPSRMKGNTSVGKQVRDTITKLIGVYK